MSTLVERLERTVAALKERADLVRLAQDEIISLIKDLQSRDRLRELKMVELHRVQSQQIKDLDREVAELRAQVSCQAGLQETAREFTVTEANGCHAMNDQVQDLVAKVSLLQARKDGGRDALKAHEKHILKLLNLNRERGAQRIESL